MNKTHLSGLSTSVLERAHNGLITITITISAKHHRKQAVCPRKRGKRAGIRAKLTKLAPKAIPLPSLCLANVRLQENKVDEIRLKLTQQQKIRDCCAHIFTWLHHNIPDQATARADDLTI